MTSSLLRKFSAYATICDTNGKKFRAKIHTFASTKIEAQQNFSRRPDICGEVNVEERTENAPNMVKRFLVDVTMCRKTGKVRTNVVVTARSPKTAEIVAKQRAGIVDVHGVRA